MNTHCFLVARKEEHDCSIEPRIPKAINAPIIVVNPPYSLLHKKQIYLTKNTVSYINLDTLCAYETRMQHICYIEGSNTVTINSEHITTAPGKRT